MTTRKRKYNISLFWRIALALLIAAGVLAAVFIVMTAERMIWNARVKAVWTEWEAAHPVSMPVYSDDLVKFSEQGPRVYERRYGFKNKEGEIVIPAQFTYVSERFSMGLAHAGDEELRRGYIDQTGKWVISPSRDIVLFDFLSEGVAEFNRRGLYDWYYIGFVRTDGSITIPPKYTSMQDFRNGVVLLGRPGRLTAAVWNLINSPVPLPFIGAYRFYLFDAAGNKLTPGELRRRLKSAPQP